MGFESTGNRKKNAGDLTQKHCPQFAKIITETKSQLLDLGMHELENLHEKGIIFVLKDSAEYPSSLLRLSNPPRWLFVKGNLPAVHAKGIVGIIGSRDASHEGHRIARALAREMVTRNLVVLSGLAKGIDIEAHQGAIEYFGQTIGVTLILGRNLAIPIYLKIRMFLTFLHMTGCT